MGDTGEGVWGGGVPMRQGNEQFGKCLLIKTIYKYARQYYKTVATKTISSIGYSKYVNKTARYQRFQVCEQNIQVQCENSRLIMEATEFESARGRKHVAGTNIYSFCAINPQLHQTKI